MDLKTQNLYTKMKHQVNCTTSCSFEILQHVPTAIMWLQRSRDRHTRLVGFPNNWSIVPLWRYQASKITESQLWLFGVTRRYWSCGHLIHVPELLLLRCHGNAVKHAQTASCIPSNVFCPKPCVLLVWVRVPSFGTRPTYYQSSTSLVVLGVCFHENDHTGLGVAIGKVVLWLHVRSI